MHFNLSIQKFSMFKTLALDSFKNVILFVCCSFSNWDMGKNNEVILPLQETLSIFLHSNRLAKPFLR